MTDDQSRNFAEAERAWLEEPDRTEPRDDFNDDVQECGPDEPTPEQIARTEAVFAKWRAENGR